MQLNKSKDDRRTKRISWGTGIALLYIGFVLGILTLVGLSLSQRVDLVAEDYYAQELDFQNRIDKKNRSNALPDGLKWKITDQALEIQYPTTFTSGEVAGKIRFYCPADNTRDTDFAILSDPENRQSIALSKLQPGRYLLQFDWSNNQTTYWNEGVIVIK